MPARTVRQDAGEQTGGLLRRLHAAVDQHKLADGVQKRILEQHQLRRADDGQVDEQQPHGDDGAEDAEGLHQIRRGPLLEFPAAVQGRGRDDRGRDQIEKEQIEDAGDAVKNHDDKIDDNRHRRQPDQDIIHLEADLKIIVHVAEAVDAPSVLIVVGTAQGVVKGGVFVVGGVFRRPHGAHEEDHPVQVRPLGDDVLRFYHLERPRIFRGAEILHRVGDAGGHALVVDVNHHVPAEVGAPGDLGQHRLPGPNLVSVFVLVVIRIFKDALPLQKIEVAPDLVEAGVKVVAVVAVGHHGVVADGGQHPSHGGVLLLAELPLLGLVQMIGVVEYKVDLLHQYARGGENHVHHQRQAHDQKDAADAAPYNLAQGLLLLGAEVKQLPDDRPDGEHKDQDHADDRHAPVDVVDGLVGKENVDEVIVAAVVGDGGKAGEHIEEVCQKTDDPAQAPLDIVADLVDRRVQDAFKNRAEGIAQKILESAPDVPEHVLSPPVSPSSPRVCVGRGYAILSRLRRTRTYTMTAASAAKIMRKKIQLCRLKYCRMMKLYSMLLPAASRMVSL